MTDKEEIRIYNSKKSIVKAIFWIIVSIPLLFGSFSTQNPAVKLIGLIALFLMINVVYRARMKKPELILDDIGIWVSEEKQIKWEEIQNVKMSNEFLEYKKNLDFETNDKPVSIPIYRLHLKPEEVLEMVNEYWEKYKSI